MAAAGVTIYGHDKLHAKFVLSEEGAVVFTANFQNHGMDSGFEVGVELDFDAWIELEEITTQWVANFPWKYEQNIVSNEFVGEFCSVSDSLRQGIREVKSETKIQLKRVKADSALDMKKTNEPKLSLPVETTTFYQKYIFEWEIFPPRLPDKAKESFDDNGNSFSPPIYTLNSKKYLLIDDTDDPEKCRVICAKLKAKAVVR